MKQKKLVIISHTEHYKNHNQEIVGWGSTICEVNYLADFWDEVVHIGCLLEMDPPASSLPYVKNNIHFVPISPYGGKRILDKVKIVVAMPEIIFKVMSNLRNATEVQLRLPTSMGLFLLPLFSFLLPRRYTFWVKYAGNWNQEKAPLSYKIQKWWLEKNFARCKVTINGFWLNQPEHCISFENPCLTCNSISIGKEVIKVKDFNEKFTLIFIGRLDNLKGMSLILEALQNTDSSKIHKIHFVGDSDQRIYFEDKAAFLKDKVTFHGFLASANVHRLLKQAHFILLPSQSEGFPKVIAEAACYGVIPIVSDVGSIPHYIDQTNGFIWKIKGDQSFEEVLSDAIATNPKLLREKSENVLNVAKKFTFENYSAKLEKYIFSKDKM